MLTFPKKNCYISLNRFYCSNTCALKENEKKKYQKTIFLPKTKFPGPLGPKQVVERDQKMQNEAKFLEYYAWQRENMRGKEFVLHDGPPYANGKPHIGHTINKILKDIILRSKLVQGNRVHYMPGWDCHGLPIELIALKSMKNKLNPEEIRQKAREIAISMSKIQMEAFKQWGVIGDWDNQCYYTFDKNYVVNQLQIFWKLYEKGLVYYDLKPVFWSPSSKTALAESELVYQNHVSLAVTVRFEIMQDPGSDPLYLLIWTTTPWTLPLNKAVFCSTSLNYSIVKISSYNGLYIIASDLISELQQKLKEQIVVQSEISKEKLTNLKYKHPWNKNKIMNIYESSKVLCSGTGLLHSVPAHGHEDFVMGLEKNLEVECFVDENGCFTSDIGSDIAGLNVLTEGSKYVTKHLTSDIIFEEEYEHSYPYDWRTDKPVIIRSSKQWFIDTNELKEKAVKSLREVDFSHEYFQTKLKNRPYWCLSRQRSWGVPIPVFFHKKSGRPLLSKSLIQHLCNLIESSGPDIWWTEKLDILFPSKICSELFVKQDDVIKGSDIMDIWFDSGISWSYALDGKKSEVYLEGVDQYGGWFQSSLLTSVGVTNEAPYKKILTHGFAVDENGKKMSKSLGNVVDPEKLIKGDGALGVDTLRWFVGFHSQQSLVEVSNKILKIDYESVNKIRLIFRFLLGSVDGALQKDLEECRDLFILDQYTLNSCFMFYYSVINCYNSYDIYKACSTILNFITNEVSARYITVIKDRLYCDDIISVRRKACQYTLNGIIETLCHALAPVLPHLAEEVYLYHPIYGGQKHLFYSKNMWTPPNFWQNSSSVKIINLLDDIKKEIFLQSEKNHIKMYCLIETEESNFELLKNMQDGKQQSNDSELTEILQVAEVRLEIGSKKVTLTPSNSSQCPRCRRYTAIENNNLCNRCEKVVSSLS